MRIGWLHDQPGYVGGAERTMAEFAAAAPEGVEVVPCPPGQIEKCDRYVIGNCHSYDKRPAGVRYLHDASSTWLPDDELIACSPSLADKLGVDGPHIPPAIDLRRFRNMAEVNANIRKGAVCVGRMAYGKGTELLQEYPEPVDVYSPVPVQSVGSVRYRGVATDVPLILSRYRRFVHLPTAFEPFGRAVVEAWACGLDLVINRNVGCRYYIEEAPEKLESAGADFWDVVVNG